jgi:uncharacterized protein
VVPTSVAENLDQRLEQFEKDTSSQILAVVYFRLPPDAALEDYTFKTYQAWKVGQSGKDNGAVLFVFVEDHKMRVEVGYGLEGVLPDSICKRIIDEQIAPRFRTGDYAGGLTAGIDSLLKATRGEYRGTGRTINLQTKWVLRHLPLIIIATVVLLSLFSRRRGTVYSRRGVSPWGGWFMGGGGWGSGGGGWGGGGGASGSW